MFPNFQRQNVKTLKLRIYKYQEQKIQMRENKICSATQKISRANSMQRQNSCCSAYSSSSVPKVKQDIHPLKNEKIELCNQNDTRLSHNFTVAVRVKPRMQQNFQINANSQLKTNQSLSYSCPNEQTLVLEYPNNFGSYSYAGGKNRKFGFNNIFIDKSNRQIYQNLIKDRLQNLKDNINLTILTYGITGSGKSYTIFGKNRQKQTILQHDQQQGLAMMLFKDIIKQYGCQNKIQLSFSYMQIYNQQVQDLLCEQPFISNNDESGQTQIVPKSKSLNVLESPSGRVVIPDLTKTSITSVSQLQQLISKGNSIRACSSNMINKLSSRSHALLQLYCYNKQTKIQNTVTIIDLAGSQRCINDGSQTSKSLSKDKGYKNLQKQGSNINRSLLALGNCIKALENNDPHVPYRNSKLTRILKQDLSGKSHNIMIACVGRNIQQADETVNTLQYASRAAKIKVQKRSNQANLLSGFECNHCWKNIPWQNIIEKMPTQYEKIISNGAKRLKKTNLNEQQNQFIGKLFTNEYRTQYAKNRSKQLGTSVQISQCFRQFKKDTLQLINNWIKNLKINNNSINTSQNYHCESFGPSTLFPERSPNQVEQSCQVKTQRAKIHLQASITDVFNYYQNAIENVVQKLHNLNKINNQNQFNDNQSRLSQHLLGRQSSDISTCRIARTVSLNPQNCHKKPIQQMQITPLFLNDHIYRIPKILQLSNNNQHMQMQISGKNMSQIVKKCHLNKEIKNNSFEINNLNYHSNPSLNLQDIETFRSNYFDESNNNYCNNHNHNSNSENFGIYAGNLRKKISIKNNQKYLQSIEHKGNTLNRTKQISKIQRMNPDINLDTQPDIPQNDKRKYLSTNTSKGTIMKKIEQAKIKNKKQYESEKNKQNESSPSSLGDFNKFANIDFIHQNCSKIEFNQNKTGEVELGGEVENRKLTYKRNKSLRIGNISGNGNVRDKYWQKTKKNNKDDFIKINEDVRYDDQVYVSSFMDDCQDGQNNACC